MKLDRFLGIITLLLQNDQLTAPDLAEKFEVSRRTISRDMDSLCMAGIPIVTKQGSGGGIRIAQDFCQNKNFFSLEELQNVIVSLKGLCSISEKPLIEKTLDKLKMQNDSLNRIKETIVIDPSSDSKEDLTEKIDKIRYAMKEKLMVTFDYYCEKEKTEQEIEPYFIIYHWQSWYVFGFCKLREEFQLYKLLRLHTLKVIDQNHQKREIPEDAQNLNLQLVDHNHLTADFDESVSCRLIETYGLNCYGKTEEGKLRMELAFTNRNYMIGWLLSFGDQVKVIEPKDIREEIKKIAQSIISQY